MRKDKIISWLITLIAFILISSVYIFNLENFFILKLQITEINLSFPIPILFLGLIFIYIFTYSQLLNRKLFESIFFIFPLAIFWKLVFFIIGMIGADLWEGKNTIFSLYSYIYLTLAISSCLIIIFKLKDRLAPINKPIIVIPGIALISYLIYQILRTNSFIYVYSIPLTYLILYFLLKSKKLFKNINFTKRNWLFIILVFILAFVVRFAWGIRVISITADKFYTASDDGLTYGPEAEDWVKGINHTTLGSFGGFGYRVFLGIIYKLFGIANYYAVIFIQALLGALVPVCIYYIAKRITNSTIAKVSSILVSLNMNNIFTSIVIGMEALFIPLIFISLSLLLKYINNGKIKFFRYPFLIGVILGITNIVRMELTGFFIIIALCFLLFGKNSFHLKQLTKIIISLTIGFLIILFSFCLRNYTKEGKFDFKSQSAAIGFSIVENNVNETQILSEMGFNPFANLGNSLKIIAKKPLIVSLLLLKGISKKGFNYLFCANFGTIDFLTLINSPAYRFPIYCRFYIYLFVLMGLIVLFLDKKYLLEKSILLGYILYTFLIYAVIYTSNARHKAVLEPLFIILFSSTIYLIISEFRKILIQKSQH